MYLRLSTTRVCVGGSTQSKQIFGFFRRQLQQPVAGCSSIPACSSLASQSQAWKFIKPPYSRKSLLFRPRTAALPQHLETGLRSPAAAAKHACNAAVCQTALCHATTVRGVAPQTTVPRSVLQRQLTMDYTALVASIAETKASWIPAKVEQVGIQPGITK